MNPKAYDILIVDDELSMRDFLEILFRREGYRVTAVDRVQKAIAILIYIAMFYATTGWS